MQDVNDESLPFLLICLFPELQFFASFDKRGSNIYTGNSKGKILIVDRKKLSVVKQFKLTQTMSNAVKGIEFSRRGESFLVNSADRVIRVYNVQDVMDSDEDPEPVQKLQDLLLGAFAGSRAASASVGSERRSNVRNLSTNYNNYPST